MATAGVGDFLQHLTRGMAAELLGVESDRQLVERVLATRDESALLTILLRHGALVYHVCRRVLRHPQDAEDAFQATFLVLAQELHTLRKRNSLAGWLHGVALRVSRKARGRAAARQRREAGAARPEAVPPDDLTWGEVRSTLDDELSRLPDKWRLPLILCYLEGQTQDKAADQLGWSKSTLRRRLEQACEALGSRLKGRGITWSAVLPAALASDGPKATAMSLACLDSTAAAALAVVNGKSVALAASARVAVLTEGVLKTIHVTKIGVVAGALIVLTLVATAVGGHFYAAHAAQVEVQPEDGPARPVGLFPLPERTSARAEKPEPLTLKGHTGEVQSVCFSPDGKRVVTGGGDWSLAAGAGSGGAGEIPPGPGEVKVWDAEKGTELLALKGHTGMVQSVCFSPDGKRIASADASTDHTVRVWDAEKGQELFTLKGQHPHGGSVCFSPDGKRIATISSEHVKVWDAGKGQERLTLKADVIPNGSVCFSPDGKRIASVYPWSSGGVTERAKIKVWDAEKGQELLTIKTPHTSGTGSVCFSPDGKRIASAGLDKTVRVWDAEKGQELLALEGHTGEVQSVCFSPDGKHLASASWDKTVKVWDAGKGRELLTLKGHTGLVRSVCFSPDGKRLASASDDKTVKVWSLDKEK
ncbi:sigma-70 family RNA polymerase sigma factor [Gemmata sp. JC673]|uniref:Sigma-70 family RNA polymerase sigma factor n=1 Tax=Gemmata algarum TaxID=2975278 RepID=A0ABU5F467_9BACT|nr:sigma-70 family RNA polymerase sigma factor [Gemmata algarum]MDY3560968.1 sigma-70 family RNA polymerase sigma factor [Gemmata algarum]